MVQLQELNGQQDYRKGVLQYNFLEYVVQGKFHFLILTHLVSNHTNITLVILPCYKVDWILFYNINLYYKTNSSQPYGMGELLG